MTDHSPPEAGAQGGPAHRPIRLRAIVLGLVLALLICALTPFNNVYRQATPLGGGYFPLAPFFILIWLTLLVAAARKLFPSRLFLTGTELLTIWSMMFILSGIAYTGLARTFFINLTAPYHFATVENRWAQVLQPLLPEMWYPQSADAIQTLYNGLDGGRQMGWMEVLAHIPWDAWFRPLAVWSLFILLCYFVMVCMVNLLSRQALRNERMNFPLLRVPQMLEEALDENRLWAFFTNRYLLAGLCIPVFLHLLNGLAFYYPDIPQIPTLILAGKYFPKYGLFSGFYKLKIYLYPAFVGFAFLASKQISLSFWMFFLLGSLLIGLLSVLGYDIPSAALGVTFGPTLSRPEEMQMIGAYGVFFLFLFWIARRHLFGALKHGLFLKTTEPAEAEWLAIRFSFWGAVIGTGMLVAWLTVFGMPPLVAVLIVGAFFMVTLVATRVICQGGIAYFTLTVAPTDGLLTLFGPKFFGAMGILIAAVVQKVLFVDLRESLMPALMHARKATAGAGSRRLFAGGLMVSLLAGLVVSFGAMLSLCYKFGIRELPLDWATRTTLSVYDNIFTLLESSIASDEWVLLFTVSGALVMLVLVVCYHRFYWWPIHPIGYLTAYSSAMRILWFSFFVGWACNALCMRYGGVVLFKQLRFFFVGMIIGDFLMGGCWAIVGLFTYASYQVLPT